MNERLIEITPDTEKAKSMMNMANTRQEMISTIDSSKYPSLVVEGYYEVIKELMSSILLLDGYKTKGEGAHKVLIDYIGNTYKTEFLQSEIYFLDELRKIRNKINYDGFFVNTDYLTRNKKKILGIISKLKEIKQQKPISTKHTHSAGGVIVKDGRVIVVNQKGSSWSLPKGHIEDGEDTLTAAKREIAEETGVTDLTLIGDLGSYSRHKIGKDPKEEDRTELKTMHMFLFSTEEGDLKPTDPDNPEARWVKKDKVAEMLTHPKDKEFYQSIIDKI